MKLFDITRLAELKPRGGPSEEEGGPSLEIDDLLSRGSDGLGLEVDGEGKLLLFESGDFE